MPRTPKPTYLDYSQALCAQTDPELFFPEKGGSVRLAKEICAKCPVKLDCLQEALEHNYNDGIWGGLASRERARLKKKNQIQVTVRRAQARP
jgi:WhiB family redox-sensing transcriptional regulator